MPTYSSATAHVRGLTIQATGVIDAPPEDIWATLVDFTQYTAWNSFVPVARSSGKVGEPLRMRVQMRKNWQVSISTRITVSEPPCRLAWQTLYPRWLLFSERIQLLTPLATGQTCYQTSETFTGLLAPLLKWLLARDLQRGFEEVALGLKRYVESCSDEHNH